MKFTISRNELQHAIAIVLKGASTRSTLPVLSGILIETRGEKVVLQSTNLELSIQYSVSALVEEEGKAVVPGKLFSDIAKNLPDAAVRIDTNEKDAVITCDTSSFVVKTLNPDDFPSFPQVATSQQIQIPFNVFSSMVKRVAKVVSRDESRAVLTGVLITLEHEHLRMVATDSYRLAVCDVELGDIGADEFEAIIAGLFLQEIASLPKTESAVSIALAENQIVVTCEDTIFINRRIEGSFPNYKQLIPDAYTTRATVSVERLVAGVKRASLLGSQATPVRFDINTETQTMIISSNTQEVGSVQETVPCQVEGESVEIAFNHTYVTEGLSVVAGDQVYLDVVSPVKPGIFKALDPENYLYLVMPVRLNA